MWKFKFIFRKCWKFDSFSLHLTLMNGGDDEWKLNLQIQQSFTTTRTLFKMNKTNELILLVETFIFQHTCSKTEWERFQRVKNFSHQLKRISTFWENSFERMFHSSAQICRQILAYHGSITSLKKWKNSL